MTELEQEKFWNFDHFVVITDKTKPAMKLTIKELENRNKDVHVVDLSDKPDSDTLNNVSDIPDGMENAIIGTTKYNPADFVNTLKDKGIERAWVHWRTGTPELDDITRNSELEFITDRCPMMYLGHDFSIHGLHRTIAKLTGKY